MGNGDVDKLLYDLYKTIIIEVQVTNSTSFTIIGAYARNSGESEWKKTF